MAKLNISLGEPEPHPNAMFGSSPNDGLGHSILVRKGVKFEEKSDFIRILIVGTRVWNGLGSIRWIHNPVRSRRIWIGLDQKFTNLSGFWIGLDSEMCNVYPIFRLEVVSPYRNSDV